MIQVSDNYADLIDAGPYRLQLTLADGTVVPEKTVRSAEWSGGSNAGDDFTLGSTVAAKLTVELDRATLGEITLADARLQAKLFLDAGEAPLELSWGDLEVTEDDSDDDSVTIGAGDAMLWAFNAQYALDDEALGFDWEAGVDGETLLQAICDACGVTLGTTGLRQITLNHVSPSGYTYREVIAFLACMWGRFARINGVGELVLQWYSEADRPVTASRYYSGELVKADYDYTVSYIKCYVETLESTLAVGDTTQAQGAYIKCPWMTEECLQAVWDEIGGFSYRPVSELGFLGDPRLEPGDVISVTDRDGTTYFVPCMTLRHRFDGGLISEITAVGKSSSASESDYQGPVTRMIERAVAGVKADLINYGDKINAKVESVAGDVSELDLKVGSISMEVTQNTGADGQVYASIVLTVGNNQYTGQILMEGNINVSGQLSADALYAALGDIADLTVDRLSTSRRIVKYLAGDTSDDNYITAENEVLAFVSGVYAGGTEQATNPHGLPIYWESDPDSDGVILGTDGYPYLNGVRIFTTTAETDYPVMVYTYTDLTKCHLAFETYGGVYVPVLTMGAGDENGNNVLRMAKSADGLEMMFTARSGKEIGITMSDEGYLELTGQRAITAIDVTEDTNGNVTVTNTLEGDVTETIVITADDNGNPASIRGNGTNIPITWGVG